MALLDSRFVDDGQDCGWTALTWIEGLRVAGAISSGSRPWALQADLGREKNLRMEETLSLPSLPRVDADLPGMMEGEFSKG